MSKKEFFSLSGVERNLAVAAGLVAASGFAMADTSTIDVSSAVSFIAGGVTIVSSLGVAALSVVVAARLFKWVRGAL